MIDFNAADEASGLRIVPWFDDIRAVMWDLDGTLIDSDPYWVHAERVLLESFGGVWSEALAESMQGAAFPEMTRLLRERGVVLAPNEIAQLLTDEVMRMELTHLPWMAGARDLLAKLVASAIPSVLVTGSPRAIVDNVIVQAPVGAFVGSISGDDGIAPKPSPEPYRHAARLAGVDPDDSFQMNRCLIFEDSLPGLTAARAAGATVIAVTGHARVDITGHQELYDLAIRDYRGLMLGDFSVRAPQ